MEISEELKGHSRKAEIVDARFKAITELWKSSNLTLKEIGAEFGNRSPATVLNAIRKYYQRNT